MDREKLVKLSNSVGIISIILLVYWVFAFITIQVFGLKVFRENLTEIFYMSILGILSLVLGALMINVMLNLTRIAQKHNRDGIPKKMNKNIRLALLAIFPILLVFLFGGDYLTSKRKEQLLVSSAKSIIENNRGKIDHWANYTFDRKWILKTEKTMQVLSRTDRNFPDTSIIIQDTIDGDPVFLKFSSYNGITIKDTIKLEKKNFIRATTKPERDYLNSVFKKANHSYRYSSHDGKYELFYPYIDGKRKVIIYFSEYQRYGKLGS